MIYQKKIKDLVEDFKNIDLNIESSNEFLSKIINEVHSFISLHIKFDEKIIENKFIDLIDENIESKEIKDEMKKAIKKENYLKEEERVLINNFIKKIQSELNSVK